MRIKITGTDALFKHKMSRGERYIRPWYDGYKGRVFDVDSVFDDVYVVEDNGRLKSVIKGDAEIMNGDPKPEQHL